MHNDFADITYIEFRNISLIIKCLTKIKPLILLRQIVEGELW